LAVMSALLYKVLATTKNKGPSKLATMVAIPFWGRGMFQKAFKRRKKGIQISKVGTREKIATNRRFLIFVFICQNDITFSNAAQAKSLIFLGLSWMNKPLLC
jgi:hypothetical protein